MLPPLRLLLACASLVLAAVVFVSPHLDWPPWVPDLAVAVTFLLMGPLIADVLTFGRARIWFRGVRHQQLWTAAYVLGWVAICSSRLRWPSPVAWLTGAVALALATYLTLQLRTVSGPGRGR